MGEKMVAEKAEKPEKAPKRETKRLRFYRVPVTLRIDGRLHATTPGDPTGIAYMLAKMPTEAQKTRIEAAQGNPLTPVSELAPMITEEVAHAEQQQKAVFRRDLENRPFVHENYIMGHMRDAAETLSRAVNIWGLKQFVGQTMFIRPRRVLLVDTAGKLLEPREETWPTHFEVYRIGRLASFRRAEYVEDPVLSFSVYLVADPRWTPSVLEDLFVYGAQRGIGGGRGRRMGGYEFELGEWETVDRVEG